MLIVPPLTGSAHVQHHERVRNVNICRSAIIEAYRALVIVVLTIPSATQPQQQGRG